VSFAGAALHREYYDAKFARRGGLLYRLLCACVDARACPDGAALLAAQLTCAGAGAARPRLRVASLGGGPGTDVAGLFWAERHVLRFGKARPPRRATADGSGEGCAPAPAPAPAAAAAAVRGGLDVTLYDLERSWRRYTPALGALLAPRIALDFAPCDVREALPPPQRGAAPAPHGEAADDAAPEAHRGAAAAEEQEEEEFSGASGAESNKRLASAAPSTHLFIFSYVAHETASAAAAAGWAFYRSLARVAPCGAVFLFADVRGRAADVFDAIHAAMADALAAAAPSEQEDAHAHSEERPAQQAMLLRRFTPAPREGPPLAAEVMVLLKCPCGAAEEGGAARARCSAEQADAHAGAAHAAAALTRATLADAMT
jgi:hypothetical protein